MDTQQDEKQNLSKGRMSSMEPTAIHIWRGDRRHHVICLLTHSNMQAQTTTHTIPVRSRPGSTTTALSLGADRRDSGKLATVDKLALRTPFAVGTWNVRSLSQSGKIELLVRELDTIRWNVVGISEMRWTGTGEYTTEDGHKVWYCGQEKKKQHGVGFIVDKRTANTVLEY